MFNMFALLLDDALKPATPLIAPLVSGVADLSGGPVGSLVIVLLQIFS